MTKAELCTKTADLRMKYKQDGLDALTDEDLETWCLHAAWSDGADWDTVLELERDHVYRNRKTAIDQLENVYGEIKEG